MLRFAADKFYKLSEEFSRIDSDGRPKLLGGSSTTMGEVKEILHALGLQSAEAQLSRIMEAATDHNLGSSDMDHWFADLHRRIYDDLKSKLIYCVESERAEYCDPKWLATSPIAQKFPTAQKELEAAGRCYAFGESNACAFHSMRALEVALGVLARHFNVDFERTNWHPAIEEIEARIREISNIQRTPQRLDDEKFFGGLGRHFMFLKNGWRNHVMHVRDTYTDREARQMLEHVTDLLTEMSPRLSEAGI